jgi:predicted PurR-regulated permease PerM
MKQVQQPYIYRLAAIFIVLILVVFALYHLKVVVVPLLFSTIFAVMVFPFCTRLEKWGFSKGLAAFISVFITTLFLVLLMYLLVRQLSIFTEQIPQISDKINHMIDDVKNYAVKHFSMKKSVVANKMQEQLTQLQNSSISLVNILPALLLNIFLIPLYVFFLLYFRHFFIEFSYKVFHNSDKELIDETIHKLGLVIKGYLFGQFLDILIIGTVNSLVLYFIGIGYSIILGFSVAILCIIPYLGMLVGSVTALFVALITTHTTWQPLTAFSVLWVIHIIDSNIVAPYVIGSRISLNPLVAIFVLFLFGELWGLPGLLLAFPLTAILKVIFDVVPGLKPYGFLLGEPEKYHLKKSSSYFNHLQKIMDLRSKKPIVESLPDSLVEDPVTEITAKPVIRIDDGKQD